MTKTRSEKEKERKRERPRRLNKVKSFSQGPTANKKQVRNHTSISDSFIQHFWNHIRETRKPKNFPWKHTYISALEILHKRFLASLQWAQGECQDLLPTFLSHQLQWWHAGSFYREMQRQGQVEQETDSVLPTAYTMWAPLFEAHKYKVR